MGRKNNSSLFSNARRSPKDSAASDENQPLAKDSNEASKNKRLSRKNVISIKSHKSIPSKGTPNSDATKEIDGKVVTIRHYDNNGLAEYDIDYTDHGDPKNHPVVPHRHDWDWSNEKKPRQPWRKP